MALVAVQGVPIGSSGNNQFDVASSMKTVSKWFGYLDKPERRTRVYAPRLYHAAQRQTWAHLCESQRHCRCTSAGGMVGPASAARNGAGSESDLRSADCAPLHLRPRRAGRYGHPRGCTQLS